MSADKLAATRVEILEITEALQLIGTAGAGAIEIMAQGLTTADPERLDAIAESLGGIANTLAEAQRAIAKARAHIDELRPSITDALPEGAIVTLPRGAS